MKTTVKLLNVDDLNCRLTIEMTVGELKRLKEQIEETGSGYYSWPLAGLRESVIEAINKAEKEFSAEIEER